MNKSDEYVADTHKNRLSTIYEWLEAAVFSLVVVVILFTFLFRIVGVDGTSMQTTLMDKDRLILTDLFYTPSRGDIVVINRYTDEPLVKRIIGVGGDEINIDTKSGEVFLNGVVLDEPYIGGLLTEPNDMTGAVKVPEGYVFVMGDNRAHGASLDSRTVSVGNNGFINVKDIMGKAVFRIFPLKAFGGLYDYFDDK